MMHRRSFLSKKLIWPVLAACLVLLVNVSISMAFARHEYGADTGLHQAEWYDPADWFDNGGDISAGPDFIYYYYGYDRDDILENGYAVPYRYQNDYVREDPQVAFGGLYESFLISGEPPETYDYYTEDWYDSTNFMRWREKIRDTENRQPIRLK